jgi:hypothetical protein
MRFGINHAFFTCFFQVRLLSRAIEEPKNLRNSSSSFYVPSVSDVCSNSAYKRRDAEIDNLDNTPISSRGGKQKTTTDESESDDDDLDFREQHRRLQKFKFTTDHHHHEQKNHFASSSSIVKHVKDTEILNSSSSYNVLKEMLNR